MRVDIVIVGGGIAGVSLAGALVQDASRDGGRRTVAVLEQEDRLAYHTTGRSAATFLQTYGSPAIRTLTALSRPILDRIGHARGAPVLHPRPSVWVSGPDRLPRLAALMAANPTLVPLDASALRDRCPALRPELLPGAAVEDTACDIDVDGIFQSYRRTAIAGGVHIRTGTALQSGEPSGDGWRLRTTDGPLSSRVVVNAAGAWADDVARRCGVPPAGLTPLRRTAAIAATTRVPPGWPMIVDVGDTFYFRPDSGAVLVSPADETPSAPCDARPDPIDVALALERINTVTTLDLRSVRTSWAGLRTFATDRNPVVGFDPWRPGFFWLAGQGGYGIQIAAGLAELAAGMITAEAHPAGAEAQPDPRLLAALAPGRPRPPVLAASD